MNGLVFILVVCYVWGRLLALDLPNLQACDYTDPVAAVNLQESGVPCSSLYTNSLDSLAYGKAINLTTIDDYQALTAIPASKCFKLRLITSCIQHWFAQNEIERRYEVVDFNAAECLSGKACVGCEVSSKYREPDCPGFTFGTVDATDTILFRSADVVYMNRVGRYRYGESSTTNNNFYLGGNYNSYVYFSRAAVGSAFQSTETYYPNSDYSILVSSSLRKVLTYSNAIIEYDNLSWAVYGDVLIAMNADYMPSAPSNGSTTVPDSSSQGYFEFYTKAQLNVLNWRMEYMDCRIKNAMLVSNKHFSAGNRSLFDLGPGEKYENGYLRRYRCYKVEGGQLEVDEGCLGYQIRGERYRITSDGELVGRDQTCTSTVRVNQSHIVSLNNNDTIEQLEYAYPTLQDEEGILNFVPNVGVNVETLRNLILSGKVYDKEKSSESSVKATNVTPTSFDLLDYLTNNGFWKWFSFINQIAAFVVISIVSVYVFKHFYRVFRGGRVEKQESLNGDRNRASSELQI